MSTEDTLSYILNNRVSVSRYGDGELGIIRNCDIGFQKSTEVLQERLVEVATQPIENHICCIPYPIAKIDSRLKDNSKRWWINQIGLLYGLWNRYFKNQPILGDTQISRFYIDYKSDENARNAINIWKQIWQDRDILIVEGDSTRLGVGNDLFANTKSIHRILCPQKNAFAFYNKILESVLQYARKYSLSNSVIGGVIC